MVKKKRPQTRKVKHLVEEQWKAQQPLLRQIGFVGFSSHRSPKHHEMGWTNPLFKTAVNASVRRIYVVQVEPSQWTYILSKTSKKHGSIREKVKTNLTALRPAALNFWNMSSHKSGTGIRKAWNSPELGTYKLETKIKGKNCARTIKISVDFWQKWSGCPTARRLRGCLTDEENPLARFRDQMWGWIQKKWRIGE